MKNIYKLALVMLLSALSGRASAQDFITRWDVTGTTSLSIGTVTAGNVSYTWQEVSPGSASGSGTWSGNTLSITGLPSGATTIDLSISPTSNFYQIKLSNGGSKDRLLDVKQWGSNVWANMDNSFFGCSKLNITATDIPNLSKVINAAQMFQGCEKLTGPSNIGSWDVSKITNMTSMFNGCKLFNRNIGNWNTANVTTMQGMFARAESFNQNIGGWNTAKLTRLSSTFEGASAFNQNISGWNTALVTFMDKTFQNAPSFNQYLGSWTLNASVNMSNMLNYSGLDCGNYAATLIGWNAQSVTGRNLGAATGLKYGSAANAARTNLTTTKGWTITGDALSSNCGGAFITQWNVTGTSSLSFGTATGGNVTYIWQEVSPGSASGAGTFSGSSLSITGLPSGATTIDVIIFPTNFQRIIIGNAAVAPRLLDVKQWGTTAWTSMRDAFFGCSNLNITATDIPNLSATNMDLGQMFQNCAKLNGPTNINSWNTSSVIYTTSMFNGCKLFNQNIGSWNTANVIGMVRMFMRAESFNQNISGWNTAKVGSMLAMFSIATSFNQDISGWNTAAVGNMEGMFEFATAFNQNISGWNTAAVTNMSKMFKDASAFNQNIGNWTLNASVNLSNMLNNSGLDCWNYAQTLIGWSSQSVTGRSLGASGRNYGSQATAARANLTGTKGWTITGDVSSNVCDAFITTWDLSIAGSGATQLSFGFATSGAVSYSWKEVGGSKTGNGTFTGSTLSLTGLPTGKTIELTIAPANFQRIISSNGNVDKNRLTNVKQWGTTAWTSMENAFVGCENLIITATGIPNLTSVNKTDQMFQNCKKLATVPNINSWDVSNVEFMSSMFNGTKFNQNIGSWNTSKALNMRYMFRGSWFNQDISGWNTAKVGSMIYMFENTPFNQNIGSWTLNASVDLRNMLDNSGMDCNNYSATLIGWNSQSVTGRTLGASGRKYGSYASSARTTLTGTKGWTITDGGQGTCSAPSVPGLEDQPAMNEVIGKASIWPNPVADMLNIEINEIYQDEKLYLTVTDMKGSVLMSQTVTHGNSAISTAGWPNALYVVTLRSEHDIIMISKISKQ